MTEPAVKLEAAPAYSPTATPAPALDVEDCPSCGGVIDYGHCAVCGERRPSERVYSLREFAHEAFEIFTNVERALLRTLWTLVRRPGELTAAYMRGERVRYLRPLQLFLLASVIYFVWAGWSGVHVFNTTFRNHLNNSEYEQVALDIARPHFQASGLTQAQYGAAFDAKSLVLARSMVVVMVPMLAVAFGVLAIRQRRPAVHHLIFSLHFFSAMLLMTIATLYVVYLEAMVWFAAGGGNVESEELPSIITIAIAFIAYLFLAFRRAYGDGKWVALLKAVVSFFAFYYVLTVFRFLLFYATVKLM